VDEMRWLGDELGRSGLGFDWAIRQVPADRLELTPPAGLGEWPALRHLHHLVWYEREEALPTMRLWLGGPPFEEDALDEGAAWAADGPALEVDAWLRSLAAGRVAQRGLLTRLDAGAWTASRMTVWGDMPLRWVVAKTYQHTAEHTSDILRIALYWDFFVDGAS
jgi:hypothetical protein